MVGSRAGKKGDYRQAVSDRNIKKQKRETEGKGRKDGNIEKPKWEQ